VFTSKFSGNNNLSEDQRRIDQQWLKKKMKMDSQRAVPWSLGDLPWMVLSISKAGPFSGPELEDGKLVPSSLPMRFSKDS